MGNRMTLKKRIARWLANRLPRRVVYFAIVRARAEVTTGQWSGTEATGITVSETLSRLTLLRNEEK